MIGTLGYLAPEVRGFFSEDVSEEEDSVFGFAVDIWAIGAIVFRMITGGMIFENPRDLPNYVTSKIPFPVDSSMGSDCTRFVLSAMDASPRKRPTANKALTEPWMKMEPRKLPGAVVNALPTDPGKQEEPKPEPEPRPEPELEPSLFPASARWTDPGSMASAAIPASARWTETGSTAPTTLDSLPLYAYIPSFPISLEPNENETDIRAESPNLLLPLSRRAIAYQSRSCLCLSRIKLIFG